MSVADNVRAVSAHCPHCHLVVEREVVEPWPPAPVRCPHCRLLIGVGRSQSEPSGEPGAKGTAAGIFSRRAKRDEGEVDSSPERVLEAIRYVAEEIGERPERLLMVDYQQFAAADEAMPPLRDVFAAFGSWKNARRQAAGALTDNS